RCERRAAVQAIQRFGFARLHRGVTNLIVPPAPNPKHGRRRRYVASFVLGPKQVNRPAGTNHPEAGDWSELEIRPSLGPGDAQKDSPTETLADSLAQGVQIFPRQGFLQRRESPRSKRRAGA